MRFDEELDEPPGARSPTATSSAPACSRCCAASSHRCRTGSPARPAGWRLSPARSTPHATTSPPAEAAHSAPSTSRRRSRRCRASRTCAALPSAGRDADDGVRARVAAAADRAGAAVDSFTAWLSDDLLPIRHGDFRLGRDLYERKFQHALKSTPRRTSSRHARNRRLRRGPRPRCSLARELWPASIGDEPLPTRATC